MAWRIKDIISYVVFGLQVVYTAVCYYFIVKSYTNPGEPKGPKEKYLEEQELKAFVTIALVVKATIQQFQKKLDNVLYKVILDVDLVALSQAKLEHFNSRWFRFYTYFAILTTAWWLLEEKLNKLASRLSKRSDDLEMQPV